MLPSTAMTLQPPQKSATHLPLGGGRRSPHIKLFNRIDCRLTHSREPRKHVDMVAHAGASMIASINVQSG